MPILSSFTESVTKTQMEQILNEKLKPLEEKIDKFIEREVQFKINLLSVVSKMYQDGEMNKDTFNKLDEFLKEYHDHPYQDGNY